MSCSIFAVGIPAHFGSSYLDDVSFQHLPIGENLLRTMHENHPISTRYETADELEQSLIAVLGAVDYGILLTDLGHRAMVCNVQFGKLFGLDPDMVVHHDPSEVRRRVSERISDFEAWETNLETVYADPNFEGEDLLTLQSPLQVLRRTTAPVRDAEGIVSGRLWTFLDVTDLHRRRGQLRVIRKVASLFASDPQEICQTIATEVSEMYGALALVSILRSGYLRFHTAAGIPEGAPALAGNSLQDSYCQFCIAAAEPVAFQNVAEREELAGLLPGRLGFTRYAGVPLFRSTGEVMGTFCILDTHSEQTIYPDDLDFLGVLARRIGAEVERQEQILQLENRLSEKSTELMLAQQRLVDSERLAITGTLAASVAHDIRNIVASASLQVDMVSSLEPQLAESVQGSLSRFQVLAHRLMSYARPSRVAREHTDLVNTISKIVELIEPQFSISGVELIVGTPTAQVVLQADEGRLEHLFVNLLMNALQATPEGGKVWIEFEEDRIGVEVRIRDTGSGIAPELISRLFEPFSTTKPDGFGLGLYSCQCIVQDHGGEILVESGAEGTVFAVRLPRAI